MRFWLDMGVDGLRLDAVPYLVEREGTNNENLPETHEVLKRIRAELDDHYPDRMLLAEANQWPEDTAPYFGDGDECHMAFHFPLMPRMYMALAQEDRHPDHRHHAPDAGDPGQLPVGDLPAQPRRADARNGDRRASATICGTFYAADRRARINLGIRRRLAPLLEQRPAQDRADERLLLSHAGHAGDLLRRRDRHGRQHLSRRPRRRAHADAVVARPQRRLLAAPTRQRLYPAADHGPDLRLPGGQRRGAAREPGIAAQLDAAHDRGRASASGVRPRHAALPLSRATARCSPICASTRARRSSASPTCRARRRRSSSTCRRSRGAVPVELLGGIAFPPIGELPYLLTLPGLRLLLVRAGDRGGSCRAGTRRRRSRCPNCVTLVLTAGVERLLASRAAAAARAQRAAALIWRRGAGSPAKDEAIDGGAHRRPSPALPGPSATLLLADGRGAACGGGTERYFLPLAVGWRTTRASARCRAARAGAGAARAARVGFLTDAFADRRASPARCSRALQRGRATADATAARSASCATAASRDRRRRRRRDRAALGRAAQLAR